MTRTVFHMRNVLVTIGILTAGIGIVYFAAEFIDQISPWSRMASLALLAVMCTALGRHFEAEEADSELVDREGWRWLRVPTALYVLGLVAALGAIIVFLGLEDLSRLVKAAIAIALGLGIVVVGARRFDEPSADG
ncbi:hypothetical protein BRD56_08345 [Thermoplasmatales archaeon SW_10_69_26]|nr:MAG: hypothetical protein BRD56_08345 [Thermoplasmatales archaeon SW_10_69_26]